MDKKGRRYKKKKPIEFTKVLVVFVNLCGILLVQQSYILAFLGYDSNSEVTVTVVSALLGVVNSGYFLKSFGEKNSRNKYDIKLPADIKEKYPISYEDTRGEM